MKAEGNTCLQDKGSTPVGIWEDLIGLTLEVEMTGNSNTKPGEHTANRTVPSWHVGSVTYKLCDLQQII